jgi:hypothetical protein
MEAPKSNMKTDEKLAPDQLGLDMVDRLIPEFSDEAVDFLQDNQRLAQNKDSRTALAKYRDFPLEAVDWLISQKKVGITEDGYWSTPFEGYFKNDEGLHHRVFGRHINIQRATSRYWICKPSGTPLPVVPFYLGDYTKAEKVVIVEGEWDAMAMAIGAGWHLPERFPLNTSILGIRGLNAVKGFLGFFVKIWEGPQKLLIIADNQGGYDWIRTPVLYKKLMEKCPGAWLGHFDEAYGKDTNDALRKGAFKDWSLDKLLDQLKPGVRCGKDLHYGPIVCRKHCKKVEAPPVPEGQRLYGINGAKDEFPLDVFPPLIQRLVEEQARIYKIEIPQSCLSVMGAISAAIGPSIYAQGFAPGRITYGNTFSLITAPPGSGKTTLLKFFDPIREKEAKLREIFENEILPSLKLRKFILEKQLRPSGRRNIQGEPIRKPEDIMRELQDVEKRIENWPTILAGKSTTPCLVRTLQSSDKYIFQVLDESSSQIFQVLGFGAKNEDTPDLDLYNSQYSHSPHSNDTVTRGRITANGWLGLTWLMQPVVKEKLQASKEAIGRGFFARCLFVDARNTEIPIPDVIQEPCKEDWLAYQQGIEKLLDFRFTGAPRVLICDKEAQERLNQIEVEETHFRNSVLRQWKDFFGRQREHIIKHYINLYGMEMVFSVEGFDPGFCERRLEKAIRLGKWFHEELAGMVRLDTGRSSREALEKVEDWMNGYKESVVTEGLIKDRGIGLDKFRTLWSLYPKAFVGWKEYKDHGRPAIWIGTTNNET